MREWMITSGALIVILLIIREIFKNKLSARIRYGLWLLVLIRLLCPVSFLDTGFSILNFLPGEDVLSDASDLDSEEGDKILADYTTGHVSFPQQDALAVLPTEYGDMPIKPLSSENQAVFESTVWNARKVLTVIWMAGMVLCTGIILVSNLHFYKKLKNSRKPIEATGTAIPVYVTEQVSSPCMFGLFKPAVYVRESDIKVPFVLQHILLHENTHYKHMDHIWSFMRNVCLVLHWYNPLVWLAVYISRKDAEFACDESVALQLSEEKREEYGRVLISLSAKNSHLNELICQATTMSGGKKYLAERIKQIVKRPVILVVPTVVVFLLCGIAVFFTFTGAKEEQADSPAGSVISENLADEADGVDKMQTPEEIVPTSDGASSPDGTVTTSDGTPETFINDLLTDMNGDGIQDIIRITCIDFLDEEDDITTAEGLEKVIQENIAGYFRVALYDGARAVPDMTGFRKGDAVDASALIMSYEPAYAHPGNFQIAYYEKDGRSYLIYNNPYMGQGYLDYSYEVYTYSKDWKKEVVASNFVSGSVNPYNPVRADENGTPYLTSYLYEELYDQNALAQYTRDLQAYLDSAVTIFDAIGAVEGHDILVTTYFEDTVINPDALDIWYWDERLLDVKSSSDLLEKLTVIKKEIVSASYEMVGLYGAEDMVNGTPVSWRYEQPKVLSSASEAEAFPTEYFSHLPEEARELPYDVVMLACDYKASPSVCKKSEEEKAAIVAAGGYYWTDFRISEIYYACTYSINGSADIDVYSYRYEMKLAEEVDVNSLDVSFWAGGMEERGDGWYEFDYGNCVLYDHATDKCYGFGVNDCPPGDYAFTSDLIDLWLD